MAALRDALDEYYPGRPMVLVLGMLRTHDPTETASLIVRRARLVVITQPPDPRAVPAADLAAVVRRGVPAVEVVSNPAAALDCALAAAQPDDVVCVTGSVYLVGAVREGVVSGRWTEGAAARHVG
jgi:dihydrofolate synthase/folylpolyglutamate synthase